MMGIEIMMIENIFCNQYVKKLIKCITMSREIDLVAVTRKMYIVLFGITFKLYVVQQKMINIMCKKVSCKKLVKILKSNS